MLKKRELQFLPIKDGVRVEVYPFAEVNVAGVAIGEEVVDGKMAVPENEVIDLGQLL